MVGPLQWAGPTFVRAAYSSHKTIAQEVKPRTTSSIKLLVAINILAFAISELCHLPVVIYAALTFFSRSLRLRI